MSGQKCEEGSSQNHENCSSRSTSKNNKIENFVFAPIRGKKDVDMAATRITGFAANTAWFLGGVFGWDPTTKKTLPSEQQDGIKHKFDSKLVY